MGWRDFEETDPGLASSGVERLPEGLPFLATTKGDGSPGVHPVTPIVGRGRLFVFVEPTSPEGHGLRHDGRYAFHSAVGSPDESQAEFLRHRTRRPRGRTRLQGGGSKAIPTPDRDVLFEPDVEAALFKTYDAESPMRPRRNGTTDDRVD